MKPRTVREWLSEPYGDEKTRAISRKLRELTGVDDYELSVQPTYEDGATPENPGYLYHVTCVPDHIDLKVVAYVTMRP